MFPKTISEKREPKGLARRTPLRAKKQYQYKPKKKKPTVSIMQPDRSYCYLCGRRNGYGLDELQEHHIIEGNGRREKSEEYGLKVYLCGFSCHNGGKKSVHVDKEIDMKLKQAAQRIFEQRIGTREEWIAAFTKSYL